MNLQAQWMRVLAGHTATFRPKGSSMKGLIASGDEVTVAPCQHTLLAPDDIVLVKVKGQVYLHKIVSIKKDRFCIGNNHGRINGWVGASAIAGICVTIAGKARTSALAKTVK